MKAMTHTSTEQPSIEAVIHDMRESWARTTHGTWGKGDTTHETVARGGRKKEYKIADFRHADDAQFCDLAHAFTPRLLAEIESLQNRVQELEASQAQRVPLTDEEKQNLLKEWSYSQFTGNGDFLDGVEAAERAHGITQEKQR